MEFGQNMIPTKCSCCISRKLQILTSTQKVGITRRAWLKQFWNITECSWLLSEDYRNLLKRGFKLKSLQKPYFEQIWSHGPHYLFLTLWVSRKYLFYVTFGHFLGCMSILSWLNLKTKVLFCNVNWRRTNKSVKWKKCSTCTKIKLNFTVSQKSLHYNNNNNNNNNNSSHTTTTTQQRSFQVVLLC